MNRLLCYLAHMRHLSVNFEHDRCLGSSSPKIGKGEEGKRREGRKERGGEENPL